MALIEYSAVCFTYPGGTRALEEVNLSIAEGEALAVIGQNGAGKTTLVKMAMGLLQPTRGAVRLHGEDLRGKTTAALARQIGFVFQNPRTQIFLGSVKAEAAFGPKNFRLPAQQVEQQVSAALAMTGLSDRLEVHPYELTPADRKLLTIASILSMEPGILILDEPTGGLDRHAASRVVRVVEEYKAQGRTVISVTHDMDFVARCFDRVVVMSQGRIVADGATRQVFQQHELLAETHLEPTAIGALAAACGLPRTLITVEEMLAYLKAAARPPLS